MNIEQNLILIKNVDHTSRITYCKFAMGKYAVTYSGDKTYNYHSQYVNWIRNPISHNPESVIVYEKGQPVSNINKILIFGDRYIRLVFKTGANKLYPISDLVFENNTLNKKAASDCLTYLKELAKVVTIPNEFGEIGFLSRQYDQIKQVIPSSMLAFFLDSKPIKTSTNLKQPIFPFGFNLSQKESVLNAIGSQISIIEGPPGTGKTQTILNIIANAVMDGKTVAIVSNNNSATANVLEKLQKYNLDFIAAYLGNTDNRESFFRNQKTDFPDMRSWRMDEQQISDVRLDLSNQGRQLDDMLASKNRAAVLKQELSEVKVENEYFEVYFNETNDQPIKYKSIYRQNSSAVMKLWVHYRQLIEGGSVISIFDKLNYLLRFGIYDFKFYNNPEDRILSLFQKLFYDLKISELSQEIGNLERKLDGFHFDEAMKSYAEDSMGLFKAYLENRFSGKRKVCFSKEILSRDTEGFLKEYPVILSTTHSLRKCASENYLFDYLIMDESTQVDLVSGALALSCARKAIIVGDLKQLPNVVPTDIKEATDSIFKASSLPEAYRYSSHSLLSTLIELYPQAPRTMLKEHYRCHPKIIGFCNKKYYNDELIILTTDQGEADALSVIKTAAGNHARGNYNERQIDVIFDEILADQSLDEKQDSIGIISPYRLQAEAMKKRIIGDHIEADTVHKFQGREKDIIILSTVANEINNFIDDPNLLNVAISRAAKKLIVVASDDIVASNSNLGDLVGYISYNNFEIRESRIYSVFDLLYSCYSKHLLEHMHQHKKGEAIPSEVLMDELVERVLAKPEFCHLDKVLHQPLKMLIRDPAMLDESECKFAMNINTHTDFLIYSKFDKSPVLVVEVDGYAFHADNPKQLERDRKKDAILAKYQIPILRLATNGSGEEEKLCRKLSEIGLN